MRMDLQKIEKQHRNENCKILSRPVGVKIICRIELKLGMGMEKVQEQGKDETRLSCCRKVVVRRDWKAVLLLLLLDYATDVE